MKKNGGERIFLIDGFSLLYRSFYAIRNLSTKDGFPTNDPETIKWNMDRLCRKIHDNESWLWDLTYEDVGSETVIVCYGSSARSATEAKELYQRKTGRTVGIIRLRMVWPFPQQRMVSLLKSARRLGKTMHFRL